MHLYAASVATLSIVRTCDAGLEGFLVHERDFLSVSAAKSEDPPRRRTGFLAKQAELPVGSCGRPGPLHTSGTEALCRQSSHHISCRSRCVQRSPVALLGGILGISVGYTTPFIAGGLATIKIQSRYGMDNGTSISQGALGLEIQASVPEMLMSLTSTDSALTLCRTVLGAYLPIRSAQNMDNRMCQAVGDPTSWTQRWPTRQGSNKLPRQNFAYTLH